MAQNTLSQRTRKEIPSFTIDAASTSYADITQKNQTPKRDQALVLDCVEGLSLTDYMCAIGDLVESQNVIGASRISNNRVCIYLSSKELVNQITEEYKCIEISDQKVTLRPLISRLKRVIFSNVPLEICNNMLDNILKKLNVKNTSPVMTEVNTN